MKKLSAPLMLILILLASLNSIAIPVLNSLPQAAATIYLDFNGETVNCAYWNGGNTLECASPNMTDAQITEVFNRVSEDYRPFNINITTDESKFLAAPLSARMRVIVTPTSSWFTGVGGVSFIGSFTWGDDTPAFVFSDRLGPNKPKMVAECCSHESGHTVGLSHQSKYDGTCNLTATYNDGTGTGETSWAPIMGNSYYRNMSGWNNGPTPYGCSNLQDNLSIITSQNGFGYRQDDYPDDINIKAGTLQVLNDNTNGVISTNTDKDAFALNIAQNSIIHIDIKPYSIDSNYGGANLDVRLSLYNASKQLIRTFDPENTMSVTVDTVLNTGSYYIVVDGAGNENVNNYGSLGSYNISTSVGRILPIRNVALTGKTEKNKHNLSWDITSDEPIKTIAIEVSTDGTSFSSLNTLGGTNSSFIYTPLKNTDLYYRLKVTSVTDHQLIYSNIISLKAVTGADKMFTVSTFIRNEITVNAAENFQYMVNDINGKAIAKGKGISGYNRVDMTNVPGGMYIIQLLANNDKITERIIKQ